MKVEVKESEGKKEYFLMPGNKNLAVSCRGILVPNVDESLPKDMQVRLLLGMTFIHSVSWGDTAKELEKVIESTDFAKNHFEKVLDNSFVEYSEYTDTIRLQPHNGRLLIDSKSFLQQSDEQHKESGNRRYIVDFDAGTPSGIAKALLMKLVKNPEIRDMEPKEIAAQLNSVLQKHLAPKEQELSL